MDNVLFAFVSSPVVVTPPRTVLPGDKTFAELRLVPAAIVNFSASGQVVAPILLLLAFVFVLVLVPFSSLLDVVPYFQYALVVKHRRRTLFGQTSTPNV